jgi:uncharacterized protein
MFRDKKMTIILTGALVVLLAIAAGVWWYVFFGQPNPPLPRVNVTVQSGTVPTSAMQTTSSNPITGSSITASVSSTTDVNPTLPEESLSIASATFNVEVASTLLEQARGLSNRPSLGTDDGMLFVFSSGSTQSFWMKDMNFPLDMIWISGNTVVGFAQNAPAEPNVLFPSQIFYSPANTDKVLEVNAGTVAQYSIKVGDTVTIGPTK